MSSKYHLVDLPDEILLSMAIELSLADILSFRNSCRNFFALIAESSLMQYLIRLMRNGLYDPLTTDMSIPQRVRALETWERAWLELSLSEPSRRYRLSAIGLDDPKRCRVQSGILIGTRLNDVRLSGAYCYLDFLHLLGQSSVVSRIDISNVGGDAHVQSWTYAPESNLMAIFFQADRRGGSPKFQFHQFSTGTEHPSAANYCLEFDQIWTARATGLECCGDNMVAVILDGVKIGGMKGDYVFLVEWKIGRITQLRKAEPGTYGTLVTFLSSDILGFALRRDAFALQVCKLARVGDDSTPVLQTICLLRLPGLLSGQKITDLRLAQPSPLSGNHPPSAQHSLSSFPFRSNPEDDILAFEIFFSDDHGRRIIFVARRRTLLSLAFPAGSDAMLRFTRAWEDWGPRTTHWMELDPMNDSMSLAGSRCVLVKYSHLRNHYVLDLRDFHPYRVHARRVRNSTSGTSSKVVATAGITTLAVLSAEACFEEDVVSELPFVSIRKENVGSRVFLDDEWMAEILWDRDVDAQVIQFHTITHPAEVHAR